MAISFLPEYGGFHNNYKVTDIPRVDFDTVKKQDELSKEAELSVPVIPSESQYTNATVSSEEPDLRTRTADLENISLNFNKGDDFSFIGSELNIENLDMQKAISDMQRDSILQDYNYFVGSAGLNSEMENGDGKVFLKL